ncbi:IclR family transcriptional regulator [Sandarakinorhabdus sp.]|uniref:IclR family transcriptional regulator n=1 Tax=Sandarakinorhabdus sp. TaxID=1916663 RepID=UPI003F6F24B3
MERRTVKSASRTLEVLELFMDERKPLRLNEIYKALGYPQSSATNLLKSMVLMGYLNYNRGSMTYLPTMRVAALGSWLPSLINAEGGLVSLVDDIQRRTDETVGLVAQNDLYIQYIMLKTPDHEHKMAPVEGTMRLFVDSSSGLALMSRMRQREIEKIYRYSRHYGLGADALPSFEDLMREVRWTRQVGYAYVPKRPTPQLSSIAMPLDQSLFGIPLAIGVGGMADRISHATQHIIRSMTEAIADFQKKQLLTDEDTVAAKCNAAAKLVSQPMGQKWQTAAEAAVAVEA